MASGSVVWSVKNSETGSVAPKMMTLDKCETELGSAALGASKCIKINGHATTRTAKTVKVVPADKPCVVWSPSQIALEKEFKADNIGQWLRSGEESSADGVKGAMECKGLLRPCFEVTFVHADKMLKPIDKHPLCFFTINVLLLSSREVVSL